MEPLRPLSGHAHLGIPGRRDHIMKASDHQRPNQDGKIKAKKKKTKKKSGTRDSNIKDRHNAPSFTLMQHLNT